MSEGGHAGLGEGVPLERTSLAWSRTGLGLAVTGALFVRYGIQTGAPVLGWSVGGLLVLGSVGTSAYGSWSYQRRVTQLEAGQPVAWATPLRLMSGLIWSAALAVLAAIVMSG